MISLIERSRQYTGNTAIIDYTGTYTYDQLLLDATALARNLTEKTGAEPGPILYLLPSGYHYVVTQWAIWLAGGIAVPVHTAHTAEEIRYLVADTGAKLLVYGAEFETLAMESTGTQTRTACFETLAAPDGNGTLPEVDEEQDALMIYTSGTTGKPKGVVMSHRQITMQLESLSMAWGWTTTDRILNVLPMHHVHGVINITCCALYNGAACEMQSSFDAAYVAARLTSAQLSLFMAVPTVYHKLIQYFERLTPAEQQNWQKGMQQMRLMISGSAALPLSVLERWRQISGHTLLERYGMTETGMILSNPLQGLRKPGYVGKPLPFVQVKIMDEQQEEIHTANTPGELFVSGPTVFKRYWQKETETQKAFAGVWFKTGDIVAFDEEGDYRILGRNSSDIIKSGGYKISALEIENELLECPGVKECAVVALPSEEWGEVIAAAITGDTSTEAIKEWLSNRLAPYKMPRRWIVADTLPRNAMGKLLKAEIKKMF
jgi:malonyl-CoA/methylmalonyl-CoA synthetase